LEFSKISVYSWRLRSIGEGRGGGEFLPQNDVRGSSEEIP